MAVALGAALTLAFSMALVQFLGTDGCLDAGGATAAGWVCSLPDGTEAPLWFLVSPWALVTAVALASAPGWLLFRALSSWTSPSR